MKKLIPILVLLLTPAIIFSADPDKRLHKECLYPVIKVEHIDGSGSGVITRSEKSGDVYKNVAITCNHVVVDKDGKLLDEVIVKVMEYENWSTSTGYTRYTAKVYKVDEDKDLAILIFTSDKKLDVATISFEAMYIGNPIYSIGCGLGDEPRLGDGKITSVKDKYRTSIYVLPGDSGSPIYYDYKVVGIAQSLRRMGEERFYHISFVIPISRVKDMGVAFVYDKGEKIPE